LAPILISFSRSVVSDQCLISPGGANVGCWHECMDRLLFASEYALDSGSRSYVSGLLVRLAGRGLDGAYADRELLSG
jgi:hypothetical protein